MNIDEFAELTRDRRSVRRFKPDPVPDKYMQKILDVARWVMSGANAQPWEFIFVKDPAIRNKLVEAKTEGSNLTGSLELTRVPEMRQPLYRAYPKIAPETWFWDAILRS